MESTRGMRWSLAPTRISIHIREKIRVVVKIREKIRVYE